MRSQREPSVKARVFRLIGADIDRYVGARLAVVALLAATAAGLAVVGPLVLKEIVDGLSDPTLHGMLPPMFLVALYVICQWLGRVSTALQGAIYAQAQWRMCRNAHTKAFSHLVRLPLRYHLERKTGAVTQVLANAIQGYLIVLQNLFIVWLPIILQLSMVATVLSQLHQRFLLEIFFVALTLYALIYHYGALTTATRTRSASAASMEANAVLVDTLMNCEAVKLFSAEQAKQEEFKLASASMESTRVRLAWRDSMTSSLVATVYGAAFLAVLVYSAKLTQSGAVSVGEFVMISAFVAQLLQPMEMIGQSFQLLSQGFAYFEKLLELFAETPEPTTSGLAVPSSSAGRLEFDRVSLLYQPDRAVLRDISFIVAPGETLGIVGASGAGKSSLVRLLVRFFEPTTGQIRLDGIQLSQLSLPQLRRAIAVVPQDTALFNSSIAYNIALDDHRYSREEVERAARLASLHEFIAALPQGYETRVGERGVKLSGGERQRVSIARAAIKRPRIYVFDEATSSLDSHTEQEIMRNIRDLSAGSTTLIIAHRLSTVVGAHQIIVLDGGTIVERGRHASLLELDGHYARLWAAQQRSGRQPDRVRVT